ncbi:MAG: phosphate ABC transporter substrate-binding protein [Armatimonadota bacterium]|nr:phosphate ABC transporter substrate-binding protein [Armatimonadota bacterium]MDW8025429.1 phosphate ABC transporter substrate-binding protein [Armatimonadota bacterium]
MRKARRQLAVRIWCLWVGCIGALTIWLYSSALSQRESITVKGSDTMVILNQRWAEEFMKKHPNATVQVTGGGSGIGIAALINGTTDICAASRPMKPKEIEALKERYGGEPVKFEVALDGISIYVHPKNKVKVLTLEQLRRIYTGEVNDWKEVGGAPGRIVRYGRENTSGTYEFLKEHVLKGADFTDDYQALPGTAAVVNAVSKDRLGIGYGGIAYVRGVRVVSLREDEKSPAYAPTEENVRKGLYPLSRPLFFYTAKPPTGLIKQFIDFALSPEGQKLVMEVGFIPIRPIKGAPKQKR